MEGRIEEIKQTVREGMKNMENSKYCTPTIEEIKVGFELQYHNFSIDEAGVPELNYDRWDTITLKENNVKIFMEYGIKGGIRVKYLDREDIEECGWKYDTIRYEEIEKYIIHREEVAQVKSRLVLSRNIIRDFIAIELVEMYTWVNAPNEEEYNRIFQGTIRNKSELKTLMRWLNI